MSPLQDRRPSAVDRQGPRVIFSGVQSAAVASACCRVRLPIWPRMSDSGTRANSSSRRGPGSYDSLAIGAQSCCTASASISLITRQPLSPFVTRRLAGYRVKSYLSRGHCVAVRLALLTSCFAVSCPSRSGFKTSAEPVIQVASRGRTRGNHGRI
jgi:hypothetical protein